METVFKVGSRHTWVYLTTSYLMMVDSAQASNRTATDREILREYYLEKNFFTSTEGVLKVLAIVTCTACSVLWFACGGCAGGARGAGGAGGAGAAAVALLATQCAGGALQLAARAPMTCFYTDIVLSTCAGAWLLAAGALGLALCDARQALRYVHGLLAIVNAALVVSSAVATYVSVTGRWDDARRPIPRPPRPSRFELDV